MNLIKATYTNNEVEPGWPILSEHIPFGKEYLVDLDDQKDMTIVRTDTGQHAPVRCVYVISPGSPGYMPLIALTLSAS